MTTPFSQFPRFYVTAPTACPYLEGRMERKVFTELHDAESTALHESLVKIGFRRSQDIVYRPSCENCAECKSVRIPVSAFKPGRTQRRIINSNADLVIEKCKNVATGEQYDLLSHYLAARHADGGMTNMNYGDYQSMIECSPVETCIIEYRLPPEAGSDAPGRLLGATLTDVMADGLSMVYSFYDVGENCRRRSIGNYLILDHIARARLMGLPYVYLGYWVDGSPKMAYKKNFRPLDILGGNGWTRFNDT